MPTHEDRSAPTPRVLILSKVFPPDFGGAGAVPKSIATEIPEYVTILATHGSEGKSAISDWPAYDAQFPFRVIRVPTFIRGVTFLRPGRLRGLLTRLYRFFWDAPRTRRKVLHALKGIPFDAIVLNTVGSTEWLLPDLLKLNPRAAIICHAHGEEWGDMRSRASRGSLAAFRNADAVIAVSSYTRNTVIEHGVRPERITVVSNGVDLRRFSPGPPQPELLQRFGVQGRPAILCLARFDERKGQDMLIRSMPLVLARVPEAVLLLVGRGDNEPRLRAIVAELKLESSVLFTGPATDAEVVGWYRTADLYVMANRTTETGDTEGFGLVFLEAAACGLPVIAGRAGGAPDALDHNGNGFLVDGRSPEDIAGACIRLLADSELRARMSRRSLEFAASKSWTLQAAGFMRVYAAAAAAKKRQAN